MYLIMNERDVKPEGLGGRITFRSHSLVRCPRLGVKTPHGIAIDSSETSTHVPLAHTRPRVLILTTRGAYQEELKKHMAKVEASLFEETLRHKAKIT
jgi:hypothetical protein